MTEFNVKISNLILTKVVAEGRIVRANDRRKILNLSFNNWFQDKGLKLGRDYTFVCWRGGWEEINCDAVIKFKDPKNALLFKLSCL